MLMFFFFCVSHYVLLMLYCVLWSIRSGAMSYRCLLQVCTLIYSNCFVGFCITCTIELDNLGKIPIHQIQHILTYRHFLSLPLVLSLSYSLTPWNPKVLTLPNTPSSTTHSPWHPDSRFVPDVVTADPCPLPGDGVIYGTLFVASIEEVHVRAHGHGTACFVWSLWRLLQTTPCVTRCVIRKECVVWRSDVESATYSTRYNHGRCQYRRLKLVC